MIQKLKRWWARRNLTVRQEWFLAMCEEYGLEPPTQKRQRQELRSAVVRYLLTGNDGFVWWHGDEPSREGVSWFAFPHKLGALTLPPEDQVQVIAEGFTVASDPTLQKLGGVDTALLEHLHRFQVEENGSGGHDFIVETSSLDRVVVDKTYGPADVLPTRVSYVPEAHQVVVEQEVDSGTWVGRTHFPADPEDGP